MFRKIVALLCDLSSSWNRMSVKERKPASSSWNDSPLNVEKVCCNLDTSLNTPLGNEHHLLMGFRNRGNFFRSPSGVMSKRSKGGESSVSTKRRKLPATVVSCMANSHASGVPGTPSLSSWRLSSCRCEVSRPSRMIDAHQARRNTARG
jgi:hypothetical protein